MSARAWRKRKAPQVVNGPPPTRPKALQGIDMALGDVVLFGQEEAWLKGVLVLEESRTCVCAVFFTHQGPDGDVVLVQPAPQRTLLRMRPARIELDVGTEPSVIEHEGQRYTRSWRRPVVVGRLGEELPATEGTATWSWFEAPDGTVLVSLTGGARGLAWTADPAADSSAVRLAGGEATLRPL